MIRVYRDLPHEELLKIWFELQQQHKPTILFHNAFTPALTHYRWYSDNNTEDTSTSLQTEDTSYDVDVSSGNVLLQLRVGVDETGNDSGNNNVNTQLRYNKNGGGATDVTGASSNILGTADANTPLTDLASTTDRATNGLTNSGTFYAGRQICDGVDGDGVFDYVASQFTEHLFPVTVIAADVADGDSITFDITIGGTPVTNSVTPTLTITKAAASGRIMSSLAGAGGLAGEGGIAGPGGGLAG